MLPTKQNIFIFSIFLKIIMSTEQVLISIILLVLIFFGLKWLSENLEDACNSTAHKLRIPASVAGATLMAIGSSAPEFFTSFSSAVFQGVFDIGLITIIWSAIFNVLVITGLSGIFSKKDLPIKRKGVQRDLIFYVLTVLILLASIWDGNLDRSDAVIFLIFYAVYIIVLVHNSRKFKKEYDNISHVKISKQKIILSFTAGIGAIGILCWAMVESGVELAHHFGVSEILVSALVFSIGTSLPDMFLSVAAAKRGSGSAAISNIFGSNTFDIAIGLGVPILVVGFTDIGLERIKSSLFMLILSIFVVAGLILYKWNLTKLKGIICLVVFACFMGYFIVENLGGI